MTVSRMTITQPELDQVQQSRERTFLQKTCAVVAKVGIVGGAGIYLASKYLPLDSLMPTQANPNPFDEESCAEPTPFPRHEVELAADWMLFTGLVIMVADPIVGPLERGARRLFGTKPETAPETFYTNIHPIVALKAYATVDYDNGEIAEILSQGRSAIIDNIKHLFGHTKKKWARVISENGQGKALLNLVYKETLKAMMLKQFRSGVLSGTLHPEVTKDDLIQMVVSLRRYGLEPQAADLETYAGALSDTRKATKQEIATELARVESEG